MALSISLELSWAVELAAATTVATVPNFAEPLPLKEFTASLWALRTNWVALIREGQNNNIKTLYQPYYESKEKRGKILNCFLK